MRSANSTDESADTALPACVVVNAVTTDSPCIAQQANTDNVLADGGVKLDDVRGDVSTLATEAKAVLKDELAKQQPTQAQTASAQSNTPHTVTTDNDLPYFQAQLERIKQAESMVSPQTAEYKALYKRIRPIIISKTQQLYDKASAPGVDLTLLGNDPPNTSDVLQSAVELAGFYQLRSSLFTLVDRSYQQLLTSTKPIAIKEAKLEARYLTTQLVVIVKSSVQRVLELPQRFIAAPIDLSINLLLIVLAIYLFYRWRAFAKTGLPLWRKKILEVRPRTSKRIKVARAIWYFDQIRAPLEWFLLFSFILSNLDILQLPVVNDFFATLIFWLFIIVFVFRLLKTLIERGKQNLLRNMSDGQSLSLNLAVWWFGCYKLSIALTALFIPHGTIISWLKIAFLLLLIPVYIFFIKQWRDDCFTYMDQESDASESVLSLISQRTGLRGFISANIALILVVYYAISRGFLALVSKVESGRRITAEIYHKKLVADNAQLQEQSHLLSPLTEQQYETFIDSEQGFVESVIKAPLDNVLAMLAQHERSHIAITGERGIGKSYFLKALAKQYPNSLQINCSEDFNDIILQVQNQLGLTGEQIKTADIITALQEQQIDLILLDNCHRLLTPEISGQRDIRRLYGWINELKGLCLWVLTFDSSSWALLNALGIATGFYSKTIALRAWSEEQITELLDLRCQQLNIDVDYNSLVIPRQLVDIEDEAIDKRNKFGIYRIIWGYAEGNPAIACRTLAKSICNDNDKYIARLPIYPESKVLEGLDINALLVLRSICQFGRCKTNDIVNNLRLHGLVVNSALTATLAQGILERVEGRYQISWLWFRTVSKYLARQNLLPR
ncbi:ATP-binding protein [Thalassotalea ponticola]|uniref:ATP-binding protein n=1 Tax=Thalassotalea ponticola TaxID=1523392 RepID=UPI0025B42547|nr:ATP-binding protein [Thalassotalea ponticola]MDN3652062.1 ATP-binding protein [Thalassotalea ponticola]